MLCTSFSWCLPPSSGSNTPRLDHDVVRRGVHDPLHDVVDLRRQLPPGHSRLSSQDQAPYYRLSCDVARFHCTFRSPSPFYLGRRRGSLSATHMVPNCHRSRDVSSSLRALGVSVLRGASRGSSKAFCRHISSSVANSSGTWSCLSTRHFLEQVDSFRQSGFMS